MTKLRGLYAISDTKLTPDSKIFDYLNAAISGGVSIFQYRNKDSKDSEIKGLAQELQGFCDEKNVLFVLNDRRALALDLGVSAVHLGRDEMSDFAGFRRDFSGLIGVSCYNDLNLGLDFERNGADYVAFGAMFASKTKPNATPCDIKILKNAKKILKLPICAIGGINAMNAALLKEADMIAVISSLWQGDSKNITQNAINIIKSYES